MQAIRSKNTKIEVLLGKAMWAKGLRYKKNDKTVFGKPDFVFKKKKIAVFCDSEFWHGKDWQILQQRLDTNKEFWIQKIQKNISRDERVNATLNADGWKTLRFWETDIKKNIDACVDTILYHFNS
jgi:DNA mismatch endonuclease (patch repair protein)